jgi:hypothetical protein
VAKRPRGRPSRQQRKHERLKSVRAEQHGLPSRAPSQAGERRLSRGPERSLGSNAEPARERASGAGSEPLHRRSLKQRIGDVSLPVKLAIVASVVLAVVWVFVYSSGPDASRPAPSAYPSATPSIIPSAPAETAEAAVPPLPSQSAAALSRGVEPRQASSGATVAGSDSGSALAVPSVSTRKWEPLPLPNPPASVSAKPEPAPSSQPFRPPSSLTGEPTRPKLPDLATPPPNPPVPISPPEPTPLHTR